MAIFFATPVAFATPSPSVPAYVPCPIAAIPPQPPHPARPSPPPHDSTLPIVGGKALETAGLAAPSGAPATPANLTATSWLVADLDSGEVLGACGAHEPSPPASVQKLLLAATALPLLDPATVAEVTPADLQIEPGSSAVGLVVGGKYPVSTLWLGLLLQSGNDAANTLARLAGGDGGVPATMAAMNAEAKRLGAFDTHAVTPSGLDGPGQFTTVYDLALIFRECFGREDFRRYDSTLRADMPAQPPKGRAFQFQNENKLLTQYPGALGGKTGFTELSRHTYVGAAERNGRRLVVTILGAEALPVRAWQQGAALLNWGFSLPPQTGVGHLVTPDEARHALAKPPPSAPAGGQPPLLASAAHTSLWVPGTIGGVGAVVVIAPLLLVLRARRRRTAVRPPPL
jgi:D-alanyl-D-alanine carboxypeptidase (penicillin-binding protein 5/6)